MSTTTAAPGSTGPSRQVQCSGTYRTRASLTVSARSAGGRGLARSRFLGAGGEIARLDAVDDPRIGERRRVAELLVLGDVAQQPAHDLSRARLRQLLGEEQGLRLGDRADELGDMVAQLLGERVVRLGVTAQDDEG